MSDEEKSSKMPLLRTIGGSVVALGATAIAGVLVYRGAPVTAWATALVFALVGATIIEPTMLLNWIRPKSGS